MASFRRKSRFKKNSERVHPSRLLLPIQTYSRRPKIATASSIKKFICLSLPPNPGKPNAKQNRETPGTQVAKTVTRHTQNGIIPATKASCVWRSFVCECAFLPPSLPYLPPYFVPYLEASFNAAPPTPTPDCPEFGPHTLSQISKSHPPTPYPPFPALPPTPPATYCATPFQSSLYP